MKRTIVAIFAMGVGTAGCGDHPAWPEVQQKPADELVWVRFDSASFETTQRSASFWAVRGEERRVELRHGDSSGPGGPVFLELRMGAGSLLQRQDGTPFLEGDSVLITVAVDVGGRFVFEFGPSGLVFDAAEPAELEVDIELSDPDLNGDGMLDAQDDRIREELSVWKRDGGEGLWLELESFRISEHEIGASLTGLGGFALADWEPATAPPG